MMTTLLRLAAATALFALAAALFAVMLVALEVRVTISALPKIVHDEAEATRQAAVQRINEALRLTNEQVNFVRLATDRQITETRNDLIGEVQGTRTDALTAIDLLSGRAQTAIGEVRTDANRQLTTANQTLAEVAMVAVPLRANLEALHEQFMSPTITVADGTKRGNPGALYPRWLALSQEAIKTSDSFRRIADAQAQQSPAQSKAMTELAQNLAGITQDVHTITTEVVRPKRWTEKTWAVVRTMSGIAILAWR